MLRTCLVIVPVGLALAAMQYSGAGAAKGAGASAGQADSEAPFAGTYYCFTTALDSDRYANNPIAVRPAPFGKLILDGKGGYTLTAKGQKGGYVFDPRLGKLTFTGTLSTMQVSGYAADSFKLNFRSSTGTFAFNCTTDGVGDPRGRKKATPDQVQRLVAGRFSGAYVCGSNAPVAITLDLRSDDDNNVEGTAIVRLGGVMSKRPAAKYAVKGRWFKEANFSLRPQNWIENPEKLALPEDWMVGQVDQDGLSHILLSDACLNFSMKRDG